jgi:alkyl hydroperoxide reductase subunit AhpF
MAIFRAEEERAVRELLAALELPVELALVLGPYETTTLAGAREVDPEAETRAILSELASFSELVTVSEHGVGAFGAERYPCVVFLRDGEDVGVRFYGTPWGYELTSLVGGIVEVGRREPSLELPPLERAVALQVFVTPT